MLKRLVAQAGIGELLETVISVDEIGVYKPDPRGYAHVEKRLGLSRDEILFVSSNGFDIAGAKAHGFAVARIERVPEEDHDIVLHEILTESGLRLFNGVG